MNKDLSKFLNIFHLDEESFTSEKLEENYKILLKKISNIEDINKREKYIDYIISIKNNIQDYFDNLNIYKSNLKKRENPYVNTGNNNYTIEKKELNIIDSFQRQYPKGFINPIRKNIIKKTIILNSKFRKNFENTNTNDFTLELFEPVKNVIKMTLSSFEIPNSDYTFTSNNGTNYFIIEDISNYQITIPNGNYNVNSFINQIEANNPILTTDYTITINLFNGKTTILKNDSTNFNLNFETNNNFFLTLGYLLGFRKSYYSGQSSYTSESVFDSGGSRYGFLYVNDYNNNYSQSIISNLSNNTLSKNILARFLSRNGKFTILFDEVLTYQTPGRSREYFGPVNISKLHIKILDEFGNLVDINNMDYSIGLDFEILYE